MAHRNFFSQNSIIFPEAKHIDDFEGECYNMTMHYIFNKERLEKVISDFYSSTGIAVALYDASKELVAASPIYSGCCSLIRTQKECVENCNKSNLTHMKEVASRQQIHCYTCHGGLMETILPIVYEDVLIAYMQIGQFRDTAGKYSSPEKICETAEKYGLNKEELLLLYDHLPVISEDRLHSLCNIMEIVIKSFWIDGLIRYDRSMLSVKIEQYIAEHLSEKIYIEELCDLFFLSKNAIYRLFQKEFGMTVNEYILKKRLALAKELLLSGEVFNVTEVSSACGFPDYNYFIRWFKTQTGKTPLQFRKSKTVVK